MKSQRFLTICWFLNLFFALVNNLWAKLVPGETQAKEYHQILRMWSLTCGNVFHKAKTLSIYIHVDFVL